jgi:hypothetical protein
VEVDDKRTAPDWFPLIGSGGELNRPAIDFFAANRSIQEMRINHARWPVG